MRFLQRPHYTAFNLWLFALATVATCQNIDTARPILREAPDGIANDSLFGYSLVLHEAVANPSSRADALIGARYVVLLIN